MENIDYLKPSQQNRQKRRNRQLHEQLVAYRRDQGRKKDRKLNSGEKKKVQRLAYIDSLPYKTSYRNKQYSIWQVDNFNPLINFLEAHKGQYWNDVYQKLNQQLDKKSAIGQHAFEHLWDFVKVNSKIENGHLVHYDAYGKVYERKEFTSTDWFYVHPTTGILHSQRNTLQKAPFPQKARWKKEKEKNKLKRRLGIKTKTRDTFCIKQVETLAKKLKIGALYDIEYALSNAPSIKIKSRVRLQSIQQQTEIILTVKVIKSDKLALLDSKIILKEYQIKVKKYAYAFCTPLYCPPPHVLHWEIFDVGTFYFKPLRILRENSTN